MSKTVYRLKRDLVIQEVEGEVFIFDGETSILHTLNQTAADLFKQLKKGASFTELGEYLAREYEITPTKAVKDSQVFIDKLKKKKLIIEKKAQTSSHE